ncbi:MAG: 50S ribosomal protein L29 [Candidatus Pacebacteria bacterium]|nr:50S ribosomal protein L29 [Candidatus Paceibacterota bacterium]
MDITDIRKKSDGELTKLVNDQHEALRVFRFSEAGSRVRNVKEGHAIKRTIARVLTELRARKMGSLAETNKTA